MGTKPVPAPDVDDTMTFPSTAYAAYPDGRVLRMVQETAGARPIYYLHEADHPEDDPGRQVTGDELVDLLNEAHNLPPGPA